MALLDIQDLTVDYGRVRALAGVSLSVREGEVATVLGANGAGKSTLLRAIIGGARARAGRLTFAGEDITRLATHARLGRGIVLVPEGRRILISMTIEENLQLGAHLRRDGEAIRREIGLIYERFPNLGQRRHMRASCLSGGEQQMLAIGRAMLARPRLMMLDEPSLGLSPLFVQYIFETIRSLHEGGLTILLVEQNSNLTFRHASRCYVLERGKVAIEGPSAVVKDDPATRKAYLGL